MVSLEKANEIAAVSVSSNAMKESIRRSKKLNIILNRFAMDELCSIKYRLKNTKQGETYAEIYLQKDLKFAFNILEELLKLADKIVEVKT